VPTTNTIPLSIHIPRRNTASRAALFVLLVCAGIGFALPNYISSVRWLLILCNAITILAPLVILTVRRRLDILNPLVWLLVAFFFMFVLRPASITHQSLYNHRGYDIQPYVNNTLLLTLYASIVVILSYNMLIGRSIANNTSPFRFHWESGLIHLYAYLLIATGSALYCAFLLQTGGISSLTWLLNGRDYGQDQLYMSSNAYFYMGPILFIPASLLLFSDWIISGYRRSLALTIILGFPICILYGLSGGRLFLLIWVGSLFAANALIRKVRPRMFRLLITSYFVLTVGIGFVGEARVVWGRNISRGELLVQSLLNPWRSIDRLLKGGDAEMFDTLANMTATVPSRLPFQYGHTLLDLVIRMLPRPLWTTKPMEASFVGQLFLDSGFFSVTIGMIALGIFLRFLWEWRSNWPDDPGTQIVYASILPFVVILARGTLTNVLSTGLFVYIPLLIFFMVFAPRSSIYPSRSAKRTPNATRSTNLK
jgi:hypothetical protein